MHNSDWIALFRQLPVDLQPQLVLVLQNRTEVCVETLFRLEPTFAVIRGRLGGTTDGGMLFLVPYDQLATIYANRLLKESDVEELFGPIKSKSKLITPSMLASARPPATTIPAPAVSSEVVPAPAPAAIPAFGRPPEATAVARNNLLERLRAARQAAAQPANAAK